MTFDRLGSFQRACSLLPLWRVSKLRRELFIDGDAAGTRFGGNQLLPLSKQCFRVIPVQLLCFWRTGETCNHGLEVAGGAGVILGCKLALRQGVVGGGIQSIGLLLTYGCAVGQLQQSIEVVTSGRIIVLL